jgi:hypothetical protein
MRRLVTPLIVVAVVGFAMGAVYRYLWDDPNEASIANYLRIERASRAATAASAPARSASSRRGARVSLPRSAADWPMCRRARFNR